MWDEVVSFHCPVTPPVAVDQLTPNAVQSHSAGRTGVVSEGAIAARALIIIGDGKPLGAAEHTNNVSTS